MTRALEEQCRRLVRCNVHLCVTHIVERLFAYEPELRDDLENAWVRVCACGEQIPHDADDRGDEWRCPCCAAVVDLDRIEHEPQEIYEWWAVSDWLADRLAEYGEPVHRDAYGITAWGRCATGQAIAADAVIADIARELLDRDARVPIAATESSDRW